MGKLNEALEKALLKISRERNGHVKMLSDLSIYIENLVKENDRLKETVKNWNKDEEIQRLEREKSNLINGSLHIMSEKERMEAREFQERHYKSCKSSTSYTLTGNGIGMCTKVKCIKCNEEKDITDIDNW